MAALWFAGLHFEPFETGLLLLAPCLALALALLLGRYPGEHLLTNAGLEPSAPRARQRPASRPKWAAPIRRTNGGLLLARALAGRAPPSLRRRPSDCPF
jgi:hypothetical protein